MSPTISSALRDKRYFGAIFVAMIFLGIGFLFGNASSVSDKNGKLDASAKDLTLSECVNNTISTTKITSVDLDFLRSATNLCYSQKHGQYLLSDFKIRRGTFSRQQYADGVILWMVVILTFSGVILSGVQLAASYKMASSSDKNEFNQQNELSIEKDKIVLKSSITGLFILLISFAFFYIFVLEVYKITEIKVNNSDSTATIDSTQIDTPKRKEIQQFGVGNRLLNGALGQSFDSNGTNSNDTNQEK